MNPPNIELTSLRPIWLGIAFVLILAFTSWRKKRWPTERDVVELIALAGGLMAAIIMFGKCLKAEDGYEPWILFTGAAVTGLVSTRGIWQIFTRKDEVPKLIEPKPNETKPIAITTVDAVAPKA
jgi:hypothetical protein